MARTGKRRQKSGVQQPVGRGDSHPPLAYLIIFVGIWGNSIPTMLVALTVSLILRMIKLVKTQTELELDKAYVLCAVSSGASRSRIAVCPYPTEYHPAAGAFFCACPVRR